MLALRPYQEEAKAAVYDHLRTRDDNPCVVTVLETALPQMRERQFTLATAASDFDNLDRISG